MANNRAERAKQLAAAMARRDRVRETAGLGDRLNSFFNDAHTLSQGSTATHALAELQTKSGKTGVQTRSEPFKTETGLLGQRAEELKGILTKYADYFGVGMADENIKNIDRTLGSLNAQGFWMALDELGWKFKNYVDSYNKDVVEAGVNAAGFVNWNRSNNTNKQWLLDEAKAIKADFEKYRQYFDMDDAAAEETIRYLDGIGSFVSTLDKSAGPLYGPQPTTLSPEEFLQKIKDRKEEQEQENQARKEWFANATPAEKAQAEKEYQEAVEKAGGIENYNRLQKQKEAFAQQKIGQAPKNAKYTPIEDHRDDDVFDWLGNNFFAGLNDFNTSLTTLGDVVLGQPLAALGWENNLFSAVDEFYTGLRDSYAEDAYYSAEALGGGGWHIAGEAVRGASAALPQAVLSFMTGGASAASAVSVKSTAAISMANTMGRMGLTVQTMTKNPQFWMSFAQTYGRDYEEAIAMGADPATAAFGATFTSFVNAGIETGPSGDSGIQGLAKGLKEQGDKKLIKWAVSSIEEGGEEILQKAVNEAVTKTIYKHDADILDPVEYLKDGAMGTVVGAILGGGQTGAQTISNKISTAYDNHQANKLTATEKAVVDKAVETYVAQAKANRQELSKADEKEYRRYLESTLERGYMSIDTIEEALGGDSYVAVQEAKAKMEEYNQLKDTNPADMTAEELDRLNELGEWAASDEMTQIEEQLATEVYGKVQGTRLMESYNEDARKGEAFTADLSQYSEAQRVVVQSAIDLGVMNNSNKTHDFVDWVAKVAEAKGISFRFTNTEGLKEMGITVEGKTVDGALTKDGVVINIQSQKALNAVVGHEIGEVIRKAKGYGAMQKALISVAKARGEYDARLADVKERYASIKDADILKELTNDLLGDYIFTDYNFIKELVDNNKGIARKIYNEIKYLFKMATPGSTEQKQMAKAKRMFEKAFSEKSEVDTEGVEYAVSEDGTKGNGPSVPTVEEIKAIQSIGRKSVNDFTAEDIQKTEKFARRYYAEMGTKSPFFRAWFGDWRAYDDNPITVVEHNSDATLKSGRATNADSKMIISWNGHRLQAESKNHAVRDRISLEALDQIDELIQDSILFDTSISTPNSKSKMPNTAMMHSFYTVYQNDSGQYLLKLYVEEALSNNGQEVFSRAYELKDIRKVADLTGGVLEENSSLSEVKPTTNYSISDLFEFVKQYDSDFAPKPVNPEMLNEDGTPKVFYHGTRAENGDFTVFDYRKAVKKGGLGLRAMGKGNYFTSRQLNGTERNGSRIIPAYLSIQNPFVYSGGMSIAEQFEAEEGVHTQNTDELQQAMRDAGYDGVVQYAADGSIAIAVTFDSNQIKSATDNIGTFDRNNPDVRYSLSGGKDVAPVHGDYQVTTEDVMLDDLGPVRQDVAQGQVDMGDIPIRSDLGPVAQDVVSESIADLGPVRSDIAPVNVMTDEAAAEVERQKALGGVDSKAIQSIGRKSVNEFTAEDRQKTAALEKQYYAEMGDKSPFFRARYGDWRAYDTTAVKVATEQGAARGVQRNADTGWNIQVSGKVFNETRMHNAPFNVAAQEYLSYINNIVENAVLLDSHAIGNVKSNNSLMMHSLYGVADIGNGPEVVKLYVEEMNDPNRTKTAKRAYQLQNIEKQQLSAKGSGDNALAQSISTADIHTVADLFAVVKAKDQHFSPKAIDPALLNKDGTPVFGFNNALAPTAEDIAEMEQKINKVKKASKDTKEPGGKPQSVRSKAAEVFVDDGTVWERLDRKNNSRRLQAMWQATRNANKIAQNYIGNAHDGVRSLVDILTDVERAGKTTKKSLLTKVSRDFHIVITLAGHQAASN